MNEVEISSDRDRGHLGKIEKQDDTIQVSLSSARFVSLLEEIIGPKEVLMWRHAYPFLARAEDLAQFHHLLSEKLRTQHRAAINIFSAEVAYSDGSSRSVTTIGSFEKLYEHREVVATAVSLRWEVLVDLGSERPLQRQVVRLDLQTSAGDNASRESRATVRIEHTHTLWANEVLAIFQTQLSKIAVRYSSAYRTLSWISGRPAVAINLILFCLALALGATYLVSGQASADFATSSERVMYHLSEAVRTADDLDKPEVLAQFTFLLYATSRHTDDLLGSAIVSRLTTLGYFHPNIVDVLKRTAEGEFKVPTIYNSTLRKAFVMATTIFVFMFVLNFVRGRYVAWFTSPGFILMTDASVVEYNRFIEARSRAREVAFHVLAVAVAASCAKLATYVLQLGGVVLNG